MVELAPMQVWSAAADLSDLATGEQLAAVATAVGDLPAPADVSSLATSEQLAAVATAVGDLPAPADVSSLATSEQLATVGAVANDARVAAEAVEQRLPELPASVADAQALTDAQAQQLAQLAGAVAHPVEFRSVVYESGAAIELIRGDHYAATDGRALTWTIRGRVLPPDDTTATLTLTDRQGEGSAVTATGSVATVGEDAGDTLLTFQLAGPATAGLKLGTDRYAFDVQADVAGRPQTLARGRVTVLEQSTP